MMDGIQQAVETKESLIIKSIRNIIEMIGDNPQRDGLLETPYRVCRAYRELFSGYQQDPADVLKTFENDCGCDQIVLLKDVEFFSTCVVGSTFIETPKGRIPISRLKSEEYVYCYDEQNKKYTIQKCKNPRITRKNAKLVSVYTEKDTLICTPDHKILTFDGWSRADSLKPGDRIMSLNRGVIEHQGSFRPYLMLSGITKEVPEHRFVYQEVHNCILHKNNHVHHIDHDPTNNDPSNLQVLNINDHSKHHAIHDGRGKREAQRWKNMTDEEKQSFEIKRKKGFYAQLENPVAYNSMIKKRSESVKKYWDDIKTNPEKYKQRIKNMGTKSPNHKVIAVQSLNYTEDVWCMDVPKYHTFIANGMVVHNCEHHVLPFYGKAHIAYIPNSKYIVGISKLARVLDIYAKRLQVQERICQQVVQALRQYLNPLGAACIIEAKHLCIACRGVEKQHSVMVTSALDGLFLNDSSAKEELMRLIR